MENNDKNFLHLLQSQTTNQQQLMSLQKMSKKIESISKQWVSKFTRSIDLWRQYYALTIKSLLANRKLNVLAEQRYLQGMESCVMKAIYNIEKLYMLPEPSKQCLPKQKNKQEGARQKMLSRKSRSNSYNSSGKRYSLFSPNKTKKIQYPKTQTSSNYFTSFAKNHNFQGFTNTTSSFYIPHKKVNKNGQNKPSFDSIHRPHILQNSQQIDSQIIQNNEGNCKQQEISRTVEDYFKQKQSINLKGQLREQITQQIGKLSIDLNGKINQLLHTLIENKSNQINCQQQVPEGAVIQNKNEEKQQFCKPENERKQNTKQKGKQNKLILKQNKILINDCVDEIQRVDFSIQDSFVEQKQQQIKDLQNAQALKKQKEKREALLEFMSICKKIKLPINTVLINIYSAHYVSFCKHFSITPDLQITTMLQNREQALLGLKWKSETTDSLNKLLKLLSVQCKAEKQQKIRLYIHKCLKCCYSLIFQQIYTMQELQQDIKICIQKL